MAAADDKGTMDRLKLEEAEEPASRELEDPRLAVLRELFAVLPT